MIHHKKLLEEYDKFEFGEIDPETVNGKIHWPCKIT